MPCGIYLLLSFSLWTEVLLLFRGVFGGELQIGGFSSSTPGVSNRVGALRARKQSLKKGTPSDAS